MKNYTEADFKVVPWKNKKGFTTELLRISKVNGKESGDDFYFKLSKATIDNNGEFSTFLGVDRTLIFLSGGGLLLKKASGTAILKSPFEACSFPGEEEIDCELLGSSCLDFNIMVNRSFGRVEHLIQSSPIKFYKATDHDLYIYFVALNELFVLKMGESFEAKENQTGPVILIKLFTN